MFVLYIVKIIYRMRGLYYINIINSVTNLSYYIRLIRNMEWVIEKLPKPISPIVTSSVSRMSLSDPQFGHVNLYALSIVVLSQLFNFVIDLFDFFFCSLFKLFFCRIIYNSFGYTFRCFITFNLYNYFFRTGGFRTFFLSATISLSEIS